MTLTKENSYEVAIKGVEKETEKAVLVMLPVSWNENMYVRSFWFPKSCVKMHEESMEVAAFLISKLENENAFNGYKMHVDKF